MTQLWQEILAIDHYTVIANGLLHEYDRKVLTFLYQPLIGASCLSLYMTLWGELEENRLWSETHSHHSLMNFMDMNLKGIYESRLKLEGIGLLKTYVKKDEQQRFFVYELQPPLTPDEFLKHGVLNIYLYKKIGKKQFSRIKRFFSEQKFQDPEYQQVTKAFQDVFTSSHHNSVYNLEEMMQDIVEPEASSFIARKQPDDVNPGASDFDFDLLLAGLHKNLVPLSAFTDKVKETVSSLAFLYGIDPIQMKNIVITAIEDNEINVEELRKAARDWYQIEHYGQLPSLIERTQPAIHQTSKLEPETQEEKLIHYFDTTSPLKFLKDVSGGAEPSKADIKIIEDIMLEQKLNPGVVNVLIDNVMRIMDMKLPRNYVEKIASQWARSNIKTVKKAMELAKKERRQYTEWAKEKKNTKSGNGNYNKKPIRTEVLPDWFDDGEKEKREKPASDGAELEHKKREVIEKLKKLRS